MKKDIKAALLDCTRQFSKLVTKEKVNVHGVLMTSLQEMQFSKYVANKGIAMNTKTASERFDLVVDWLLAQAHIN